MTGVPRRILPVIVIAQLAGASMWFAGNAVMPDLQRQAGFPASFLGDITIAVQLGFIAGTLVFAWLSLADRFSPRRIYLACALIGAVANGAVYFSGTALWPLLGLRFATGFCLAGIYPVGMKIASGWFDRDLGKALGYLVGALVLGTALPHLIRAGGHELPWQGVILVISAIAAAGGVMMYLAVPDGPHLRQGAGFDPGAFLTVFRAADFRASAFGYFGHMWELYVFWAFVPVYLAAAVPALAQTPALSAWVFVIIAAGAAGCIGGGYAVRRVGSARVASAQLAVSALCCLVSPLAVMLPVPALLAFLVVWGVTVVGDSPQFSTLNAQAAPPRLVGSALTIVNCIGFSITIVALKLASAAVPVIGAGNLFALLVPGPLIGLAAMWRLARRRPG